MIFDAPSAISTQMPRFTPPMHLAAAGGKLKAVDRSFDTTSRDGGILIEFRPLKGSALVSALSIVSLDPH
jgi:hypothetical protein